MNIIGHATVWTRLKTIAARKNVSQTYIFYGPSHIGKHFIARQFAHAYITQTNPQGEYDGSGGEDALLECAPEREEKKGIVKTKDISVETIRDILRRLSLSSRYDGRRVLIIDDAHRLTRAAQNALLKSLEEPRPGVVTLLITPYEEQLLDTIRSRAQSFSFRLPTREEFLVSAAADQVEAYYTLSEGRPGFFMRLCDDEAFRTERQDVAALWTDFCQAPLAERFGMVEQLAKDTERVKDRLQSWLGIEHVLTRENPTQTTQRLERCDVLAGALRTIESTNTNVRLVLEDMAIRIA